MKRTITVATTVAILSLAVAGHAQQPRSNGVKVSGETEKLFKEWFAAAESKNESPDYREAARGPELRRLVARPDADLCLARFATATQTSQYTRSVAMQELGKLDTQRSFDRVAALLESQDTAIRGAGVEAIGEFRSRPEVVPLLAKIAERDPEPQVRYRAATALAGFDGAQAEESLVIAMTSKESAQFSKQVSYTAAESLARMNSQRGAAAFARLLQSDLGDEEAIRFVDSVRGYRRKVVVEAVLKRYASTPPPVIQLGRTEWAPGLPGSLQRVSSLVMRDCFEATGKALGPQPDDYYEEWQDWWNRVEPLLTDDLKLKKPLEEKPKQYAEFGNDPSDIELQIAVDSLKVRFHDPIRLDLTFKNKSDKPYKVVLPKPPSGWMPTMAYGIHLARGEELLVNLEPSDYYLGSYFGPPPFEVLAPHQEFRSSVCLQYFLDRQIKKKPLSEGTYEFKLTFDPGKYAGIHPQGAEIVHRWDADPIKFMIAGEERTDTKEILDVIAHKSGLPFFKNDLFSPNYQRREPAEHILYQYADKRLRAAKSVPGRIQTDPYLRD